MFIASAPALLFCTAQRFQILILWLQVVRELHDKLWNIFKFGNLCGSTNRIVRSNENIYNLPGSILIVLRKVWSKILTEGHNVS